MNATTMAVIVARWQLKNRKGQLHGDYERAPTAQSATRMNLEEVASPELDVLRQDTGGRPLHSFTIPQLLTFAETIHHRGFGGAQFDPFRAINLYFFVELFGQGERIRAHLIEPIELALKSELA